MNEKKKGMQSQDSFRSDVGRYHSLQEQQQQRQHKSSNDTALSKCNSVVWEGILKATEVVVRSRCVLDQDDDKALSSIASENNNNTSAAATAASTAARRFNLELESVPSIRKSLLPWKKALYIPLQLDIFYHFYSYEKQRDERILLERWCFEYQYIDPSTNSSSSRSSTTNSTTTSTMSDLRQVVKNLVVLLRSLLCFTRLLPAYSIHCYLTQCIPSARAERQSFSIGGGGHNYNNGEDGTATRSKRNSEGSLPAPSSVSTQKATTFIGHAFHGAAINPKSGKYDTNDPYLIRNNFKKHTFRVLTTPYGKLHICVWYHPLSTQIASSQLQQLSATRGNKNSIQTTTPTASPIPIMPGTSTGLGNNHNQEQLLSDQQPSQQPNFPLGSTPTNVSEFLIPDYHSPKPESFLKRHHEQQKQKMVMNHPNEKTNFSSNNNQQHTSTPTSSSNKNNNEAMKPSLSGLSLAMMNQDAALVGDEKRKNSNPNLASGELSSETTAARMQQTGSNSTSRAQNVTDFRRRSSSSATRASTTLSSLSSSPLARHLSQSPGPFAMLSEAIGTARNTATTSSNLLSGTRSNRALSSSSPSSNNKASSQTLSRRPASPPFGRNLKASLEDQRRIKDKDRGADGIIQHPSDTMHAERGETLFLQPHSPFEKLHNSPFLLAPSNPSSSSKHNETSINTDNNTTSITSARFGTAILSASMNNALVPNTASGSPNFPPLVGLPSQSLLPLGSHHNFGTAGSVMAPPHSSLLGLTTMGGGTTSQLVGGTSFNNPFQSSHLSSLSFASGAHDGNGPFDGSSTTSFHYHNNKSTSAVSPWDDEMPFVTNEEIPFGSNTNDGINNNSIFGGSVSAPAISFSKQCSLASHLSILDKSNNNAFDSGGGGTNQHLFDGSSKNNRSGTMTLASFNDSRSNQNQSSNYESQQHMEQLASFKQFASTLKLD